MNKKLIIGGIIGVIIVGIAGYSIVKSNKKKEANKVQLEQRKETDSLNKADFNKSIDGLSDQELIKKYLLLKESKVSVKDRAEASEVARKFVKAITIYNSDNPTEGEKDALSCVSDDIYKEVQGMFITKGKDKESDIKERVVTKFHSEEIVNDEDNNYIYIDIIVSYDNIDKNGEKHKDSTGYTIQLLKINGQYKVTSFRSR